MSRSRVVILAAVIGVFLAIGGYLVVQSSGGGGHPVSIALSVSGSTMTPETPTAKQGDQVTLTVTADKVEEIHLHGYDISFAITSPGGEVTHTFTADKTGTFPIEIEQAATPLGRFQVSP